MREIQLALILLISVIFYNTEAQQYSIRGGFGLATISASGGQIDTKMSSIFRSHLGIIYEHPIQEKLFFQTGLIIEGKGVKETSNKNNGNYTIKTKPLYLIVPIGVKYFINNNNIFCNGGFYAGYGIGGKVKASGTTYSGNPYNQGMDVFGKDGLKKLDFGIELGGGILVPSSFGNLELGLLLSFGLTNLGEPTNINVDIAKNQVYKVYAALPLNAIIKPKNSNN